MILSWRTYNLRARGLFTPFRCLFCGLRRVHTSMMEADRLDPTHYSSYNEKVRENLSKKHQLQKLEERGDKGSFSKETWTSIYHGRLKTCWRGIIMIKGPFEIVTYQQLMWDVKPRTVLEFGANTGGSAVWIADTLRMYGCDSHVYSMDIDLGLLEPLAREKRDDLTFLQGDCNEVEKTFTPELLKSLPHPWFVTEDAHVNFLGVLDYIDQFTVPGDYIVVEDTNTVPAYVEGLFGEEFQDVGAKKLKELKKFVSEHSNRYRVDTAYNDFFGFNNTVNVNGYLKRV